MNDMTKAPVGPFGKAVARHLQARRAHQQVTQQQLSAKTEISQSQLSKQLRGLRAINIDEFEMICSALNISMEEILALAEAELEPRKVLNFPGNFEHSGTPDVADEEYDDDDLIDGINNGTIKHAAQEATDPLDETWS